VLGVARPFVYCIDQTATTAGGVTGTVRPVEVALGATVEGQVEVRNGIEPGQLVVTRGNERLRPGAVVSFQIPTP
jgi:multidrug efflux pump subunit AcrA (membrane-fusion protein)